jgi:hypothetical protein
VFYLSMSLGVRMVSVVVVGVVTTAHQKRSVTVRGEGSVKVSASADDDWRQVVLVPVVVGGRGLPYGKREVVDFLFGKKVVSSSKRE